MEVFVPMCCDIIHIGHINILKIASKYGKVTVGLMSDRSIKNYKRIPIFCYDDRKEILNNFKQVHNIISIEGGPNSYKDIIINYKPKVFVHGTDWRKGIQKKSREEVIIEMKKYNGKVIEPEYTLKISTTSIINSLFELNLKDTHKKKIGYKLRTLFNTLKRPIPVISKELNVDNDTIVNCINGTIKTSTLYDIIIKIYNKYPISYCSIWNEDNIEIISYCNLDIFNISERITHRKNKDNELQPYYCYKDLAMNRLSPIVPEWIRMLRVVYDSNEFNPDVCMNNGHFMWQMTYFIGEINFYYEINGKRYVFEANTGDTNIISQYIPHSFTKRNNKDDAYIIAITFEGNVQRSNKNSEIFPIIMTPLQRCLNIEHIDYKMFASKMSKKGIKYEKCLDIINNDIETTYSEKKIIADLLHMHPRDLWNYEENLYNKVWLHKYNEYNTFISKDGYTITPLIRCKCQPWLKPIIIELNNVETNFISVDMYQLVYNLGNEKIKFIYYEKGKINFKIINKNESLQILPSIKHKYTILSNIKSKLLIIQYGGERTTEWIDDLRASYSIDKINKDIMQWY